MKTQVKFWVTNVSCAIKDGKILQLAGSIQATMSLSIAAGCGLDDEDPDNFPWSVLAATFEFADSEGKCWQITSRFGSDLLIRSIMDFSNMNRSTIWDELSSAIKGKFEKHIVLKDIWYSSDDRFIRPLIVGETIKEVQFKYFCVSFDLAVFPNTVDDDLHLPELYARTTSPIYDYKADELPSLYFPIDWKYFLVNSYCLENGASDIPLPFIAEPTGRTAKPQPSVKVLETT